MFGSGSAVRQSNGRSDSHEVWQAPRLVPSQKRRQIGPDGLPNAAVMRLKGLDRT